jgi:hypothetical protein
LQMADHQNSDLKLLTVKNANLQMADCQNDLPTYS